MNDQHPTVQGSSCLALENINNARDLGGMPAAGGRRVRCGKLFRSGNPAVASAADLDALRALALDLVIDFRSPAEKAADESAFAKHFNVVATPVLDGSMAMDLLMPRLRASTPAQVHGFMEQAYADFPVRYRSAFAGLMERAQEGRTMLFHCTAGKDRTGFASLLLLSALGVSADDILADYLASNEHNRRFIAGVLSQIVPLGVREDVMMPLLEVRPAYLEASLHAIRSEYGNVDRYLCDGLGVDAGRLREHYLDG